MKIRVMVEFELDVKDFHTIGESATKLNCLKRNTLKAPTESDVKSKLSELVSDIYPNAEQDKYCPFIPIGATIKDYTLMPSE